MRLRLDVNKVRFDVNKIGFERLFSIFDDDKVRFWTSMRLVLDVFLTSIRLVLDVNEVGF